MIRIHATQKLLAKLPINEQGVLPVHGNTKWLHEQVAPADNLLDGWHANVITLQRRNCVLFVHDTTRFPVFIPGLTKPYFERLDWWFVDGFMNTILKIGATEEHMTAAHLYLSALSFDNECDRSVQGTMNQAKKDLDCMLSYREIDVVDLSGARTGAWLADRPCTVKGQKDCVWPDKLMLQLLYQLAETSIAKTNSSNVVSLDKYR